MFLNHKDDLDDKNMNKYILPLIIIGGIILLIVIIFLVSKLFNRDKIVYEEKLYYINLIGSTNITMYQGDIFVEPGYKGTDDEGNDLTQEVVVSTNINSDKIGNYKVSYTLGNVTKERNVKVIDKPTGATYIHLYGDVNVFLYVGEKYDEKGYEVIDTVDGNSLKDKVIVNSNVNTEKEGIYKVIYSVTNTSGITTSKVRTVIVMDPSLSLIPSPNEVTNGNVTINIYARDELFDYLVLPNNMKETKSVSTYEVSNNGTYKFIMYNNKGESREKSIEITNIDREVPSGSCSGYYGSGISQITIKTKDNVGISKYEIDGTSYTSTSIKLNKEVSSVNITIYDKAGNTKAISCTLEDKRPTPSSTKPSSSSKPPASSSSYEKPITPPSNINYTFDTDTLKVWIEKTNTYYVSHIWVKDAYHQLKTGLASSFGNTLERPNTILTNATNKNNLQRKAIIAVNASGFILNGTFGQEYYNANPLWNKTSESPIVIFEGNVLRDFANGKIPNNVVTYGLKANGDLAYYQYKAGTNLESNIKTSKQIISDGVSYTMGFRPALVDNGQVLSNDTSPNMRQGFCQINKNNFVFITNNTTNRSIGFSFKTLGELMVSMGCKTGVNLDGGGSTSLLIKDNKNNITTLFGNNRNIADILYFHE